MEIKIKIKRGAVLAFFSRFLPRSSISEASLAWIDAIGSRGELSRWLLLLALYPVRIRARLVLLEAGMIALEAGFISIPVAWLEKHLVISVWRNCRAQPFIDPECKTSRLPICDDKPPSVARPRAATGSPWKLKVFYARGRQKKKRNGLYTRDCPRIIPDAPTQLSIILLRWQE